jgi:hypothetical protein
MHIVIYVISAIFIVLAGALVFAWYRTRHAGLALMAATYGAGAFLALLHMTWWPLLAGFVLAWLLRLMGYDPGPGGEVGRRRRDADRS